MDEFEALDGVGQAELVRRGEVKSIELVESAIARIETRDPKINAVITKTFEKSLDLAQNVDHTTPLAGIPILIKDQLDWAGIRTSHGSAFRRDHVATESSVIVQRWLDAGVIPLGKTNVPECGLLATTEPAAYGATCNPWDLERTVGGSSGGSAAAVASGLVAVATASDGGGSIRIPAAACGVFGLKPTRGRTPGSAGWGGLVSVHVVSRTVRDSAAFLDAACGPQPGDVTPLPKPQRTFQSAVTESPGSLRVAMTTEGWEGVRYSPVVIDALRRTADLLTDLGHHVVEARPAITPQHIAQWEHKMIRFVTAGTARNLDLWAVTLGRPLDPSLFEPLTWEFAEQGRKVTATEMLEAFEAQANLASIVRPFFDEFDLWLLPTTAEIAPRNGEWKFPAEEPMHGWLRMAMFVPPLSTALANYTGQPAMSVPLENDAITGLPVGSMMYGRWGEERTLLSLAAQLEQARPWAHRRPSF